MNITLLLLYMVELATYQKRGNNSEESYYMWRWKNEGICLFCERSVKERRKQHLIINCNRLGNRTKTMSQKEHHVISTPSSCLLKHQLIQHKSSFLSTNDDNRLPDDFDPIPFIPCYHFQASKATHSLTYSRSLSLSLSLHRNQIIGSDKKMLCNKLLSLNFRLNHVNDTIIGVTHESMAVNNFISFFLSYSSSWSSCPLDVVILSCLLIQIKVRRDDDSEKRVNCISPKIMLWCCDVLWPIVFCSTWSYLYDVSGVISRHEDEYSNRTPTVPRRWSWATIIRTMMITWLLFLFSFLLFESSSTSH